MATKLAPLLCAARAQGAALVAAHPYERHEALQSIRRTAAFATDPDRWAPLVDRFELFNRDTLFDWVADAKLPMVASGDFHRLEHLAGWKTLLPCAKDEHAVVGYLRSSRPAFLVRLDCRPEVLTAAA
jgi:processive 1,2-diacylglycerol beta-glucosyltransferase